jgi:RNA recognition motif-containing protein
MKIYVGNLSLDTTKEDLYGLFEKYGQTGNIEIIEDEITGISHRYGLIEMPDDQESISAISALNKMKFKGQKLYIHSARVSTKDRRGSSRGGGRRQTDRTGSKQKA